MIIFEIVCFNKFLLGNILKLCENIVIISMPVTLLIIPKR